MKNQQIFALTTTMLLAGGLFAQSNFDNARQKGHSTPIYRAYQQEQAPMQASMPQEGMEVAARDYDPQLGAEVYGPDGKMLGRVTQVHRDANSDTMAYEVAAITPENTLGDSIRVDARDVEFHDEGIAAYATVTPGVHDQLAALPANQGDTRYLPNEALVSNEATAPATTAQDFPRERTTSVAMNESNLTQEQLIERSMALRPNEARRIQSRHNGVGLFRNNEVVAALNEGQTTRTYFETASPADDATSGTVTTAEPLGLKDALHQQLSSSPEAQDDLRQVQINRDGNVIVLEGQVSSQESKQAIEQALRNSTAMQIRNELEVE
ncbi:MAG: hypothetical protein Q7P63_06375 [Verrucomicrobiota bacterium JB022]|nr:hypothetical protein [Verrucomicrobiota bacterium JB022]